MKKIFFFVIFALAFTACQKQTVVNIKFEGQDYKNNLAFALVTPDSTYTFTLDSTQSVSIVLPANAKHGFGYIAIDRQGQFPVFIQGKSFDAIFTKGPLHPIVKYIGEGAAENTYMLESGYSMADFKLDEEDFIKNLPQVNAKGRNKLDSMNLSKEFFNLQTNKMKFDDARNLAVYPSYHAYYAQKADYVPSDAYYNVLRSYVVSDPTLLDLSEYQLATTSILSVFAEKAGADDDLSLAIEKHKFLLENYPSKEVVSFFTNSIFKDYVQNNGVGNLDKIKPLYYDNVTDATQIADFEKLCHLFDVIKPGNPSPSFNFLDIDGKEVSLASLAGKYVYIDVWATWCGPCKGELPYLKELEEKYSSKNIHFVSISCDQDKSKWENMVKSDKLGGIQLHVGDDRAFMYTYMINGIPRFILLDKEGKIIDANMTRPSNPKTAEMFDSLEGI